MSWVLNCHEQGQYGLGYFFMPHEECRCRLRSRQLLNRTAQDEDQPVIGWRPGARRQQQTVPGP